MYDRSSRSLPSAQLLIYHPHHQKSLDTHTHKKLFTPIYICRYILPELAHRLSQIYVSNLEDAIRDLSYLVHTNIFHLHQVQN